MVPPARLLEPFVEDFVEPGAVPLVGGRVPKSISDARPGERAVERRFRVAADVALSEERHLFDLAYPGWRQAWAAEAGIAEEEQQRRILAARQWSLGAGCRWRNVGAFMRRVGA